MVIKGAKLSREVVGVAIMLTSHRCCGCMLSRWTGGLKEAEEHIFSRCKAAEEGPGAYVFEIQGG